MYAETLEYFAKLASAKVSALKRNPLGFFVGSMMAGAYVGLGIILIFIVGSTANPAYQKLVMGASFGIALTLVVFAGSELFTGHTMYMSIGWLKKTVGAGDVLGIWSFVWLGNLVGSAGVAAIFVLGGAAGLVDDPTSFLYKATATKMNAPVVQLLARSILCNWLVTLALWMSARATSDAGKAIAIFWCLYAFIASGFEHSVANMTLFTIALLGNHPASVSVSGMAYNLVWVTLGNLLAGSLIMGVGYWLYSGPQNKVLAGQAAAGAAGASKAARG